MSLQDELLKCLSTKAGKARLGSDKFWHTGWLPTGIEVVDYCLGGGFGRGRSVEIYGLHSAGKTFILYLALAHNQKQGGLSVLVESEGAYSKEFFRMCGGNPDTLVLPPEAECSTVEGVFTLFDKTADMALARKSKCAPIAIGWDSIAQTGTNHLMDVGMDKRDLSASFLISQGCKLITTKIKSTNMCILATNQTRDNLNTYSSETNTPGGRSWKFYASQRLELELDGGPKTSKIYHEDDNKNKHEIGHVVRGSVTKNKLATPGGKFWLPMYTEEGFPHPLFKGQVTKFGVDRVEAAFLFFLKGRCFLEDATEKDDQGNPKKVRVLNQHASGWYTLDKSLDPDQTKFRASDWPKKLEQFPQVMELLKVEQPPQEQEQDEEEEEPEDE